MKLPHKKEIKDRRELICEIIKGKKVLHIGCTDAPFTEIRINNMNLLHQQMAQNASKIVGTDINKEGIEIMRENGIKEVYVSDIYNLCNDKRLSGNFDYIVMTEVLEHLPNAGAALNEVKVYIKKGRKNAMLLMTVPNINSYLRNIIDPFLNQEVVHPDHVCYYSYSTLKTLLESTGFEIVDIRYVSYGLSPISKPLACFLNFFSSSFLPSIYVLAKVK